MVILAPGVDAKVMVPPLDVLNALRGDSREQLHQMIHDLGDHLGITPGPPHTYGAQINRILALSTVSAGESSVSDALSWPSFLSQLRMISSENGRLACISNYITRLPSRTEFSQLVQVLLLISSEAGKLRAAEELMALFERPSEQEVGKFLSLFSSESGRCRAIDLIHGT